MADVDLRVLERRAAQGDEVAQLKLEHQRCRIGEHCGCRVDTIELSDKHWLAIDGFFEHKSMVDGTLETADEGIVTGRVTFEVSATNRVALMERLTRLCYKLSVQGPPAPNVIDRPCPHCQAAPGDVCMTSGGNQAKTWHVARSHPPEIHIARERWNDADYDYDY